MISNKKFVKPAIWLAILLFLLYGYRIVPPTYSFANDSLIKLIMAQSLDNNNFQNEDYYYPFQKLDPNYKFYPIASYELYFISDKNSHKGPFSIFFSYMTAFLLKIFKYDHLPFISGFMALMSLIVLSRFWQVKPFTLLIAAATTSLIIYSIEYSENIFFIFTSFTGITLFLKRREELPLLSLSGVLLGLSVFLRLETLLWFPFFFLTVVAFFHRDKRELKRTIIMTITFSIMIVIFFSFNYIQYHHILGPKYLVDKENFYKPILSKIMNYISMYFGKSEGFFFKVGFFGLTPLFLVVILWMFKHIKHLSVEFKILLFSSICFLLIAPAASPHDGQWSWGARYFNILIFPAVILTNEMILWVKKSKNKNIYYSAILILSFYSFLQNLVGLKILSASTRGMKTVQQFTAKITADIRIFHNGIFSLYTGPQIIDTISLVTKDKQNLNDLIQLLEKNYSGKTICWIYSDKLDFMMEASGARSQITTIEMEKILSEKFQFLKTEKTDEVTAKYFRIK